MQGNDSGARIKPGLEKKAQEWILANQVQATLVTQLIEWLTPEDKLNLASADMTKLSGWFNSCLVLSPYHSGVQGDPLRVRFDQVIGSAHWHLYQFLEERDPEDHFGQALKDQQFMAEIMPASEFVFDDWQDPHDSNRQPVAATREEVLGKAAAQRDHARFLERLANGKTLEDEANALLATARGHVITGPYEKVLSKLDEAVEKLGG